MPISTGGLDDETGNLRYRKGELIGQGAQKRGEAKIRNCQYSQDAEEPISQTVFKAFDEERGVEVSRSVVDDLPFSSLSNGPVAHEGGME